MHVLIDAISAGTSYQASLSKCTKWERWITPLLITVGLEVGWRQIYILFHFIFFILMIKYYDCNKQPRLVALQQLTLPDDMLVLEMHQCLTVEENELLITRAETQDQESCSFAFGPFKINSHILLPFLDLTNCIYHAQIFCCSCSWRMAAAVSPRRHVSSGGWTAGACSH